MERDYEDEHQQLLTRRERLRAQRQAIHSSPARIRLRLGAVVAIIAALLSWLAISWLTSASSSGDELPEAPALQATSTAPETDGDGLDAEPAEEAEEPATVVVHVAGAVKHPQVVELDSGTRVSDAVEAAGGLTEEAAAQGVNLAAEAMDGSFIWIPTLEEFNTGEPPPAAGSGPEEPDSAAGEGPININTAQAQELEQLPGIGPALAERIITYRETNGGFGSLDELAAVSGIGPAILENIADDVDW